MKPATHPLPQVQPRFVVTSFDHAARQATAPISFTPLEQKVLHLSLQDPLISLRAVPKWLRPLHALFANPRPTLMADPHLEALRRFAVLQRHHGVVAQTEHQRFEAAGYSPGHARRIAALIRPHQRQRVTPTLWMALVALVLLLAAVFISRRRRPFMIQWPHSPLLIRLS